VRGVEHCERRLRDGPVCGRGGRRPSAQIHGRSKEAVGQRDKSMGGARRPSARSRARRSSGQQGAEADGRGPGAGCCCRAARPEASRLSPVPSVWNSTPPPPPLLARKQLEHKTPFPSFEDRIASHRISQIRSTAAVSGRCYSIQSGPGNLYYSLEHLARVARPTI